LTAPAPGVIRAEGLDALSMRRLSRELGRSAMAPYWYVTDRHQLLDLVARELLADVPVPAPDSGQWETRLREVIAAIDARLREHLELPKCFSSACCASIDD
jgi:AcrR family transcriptional regulator